MGLKDKLIYGTVSCLYACGIGGILVPPLIIITAFLMSNPGLARNPAENVPLAWALFRVIACAVLVAQALNVIVSHRRAAQTQSTPYAASFWSWRTNPQGFVIALVLGVMVAGLFTLG